MTERRFQLQIHNVIDLFSKAREIFNSQKPVDSWLSTYFRRHRKYGSQDRRLISACIFGYFRWYGWLRQFDRRLSLALLLGYLLDNNKLMPLIEYWGGKQGLGRDELLDFVNTRSEDLLRKHRLTAKYVDHVKPMDLNPECAQDMSLQVLASFQTRPRIWIRTTNQISKDFFKQLSDMEIGYSAHPTQPTALALEKSVNLHEFSDLRNGNLEVQDIASQGVGLVCKPQPGDIWWDVCAGSGGKSLHFADMMNGEGIIYATETYQHRLRELQKRISRNKRFRMIRPLAWDGKDIPSFSQPPTAILIDAPCTCSGTWRRAPDIRWHSFAAKILEYARLQLKILTLASRLLEKGGVIIYATCSLFREENEAVVESFLDQNESYSLEELNCPFTGKKFSGGIKFLPPEPDGNAMYVAKMVKKQ